MKKGIKWLLVVCAVIVGSGLAACGGASEEAKEPLNTHAAKQESIDESAVSENENDMGDNSEAVSVSSSVGGENNKDIQAESQQEAQEEMDLELVDYGWYINPISEWDDTAYVDFCGIVHNPNENLMAEFPEVIATLRNGDGSILATGSQMGGIIMPGDTVTLIGMLSMPVSDASDDAQIEFDVEWDDFIAESTLYTPVRSSDLVISNVSERSGEENFITGEITNNYTEDIDSVNIAMVLRKEGEIVYVENTYLDGLKVGKAKAFQFTRYENWPDHDDIEITAQAW